MLQGEEEVVIDLSSFYVVDFYMYLVYYSVFQNCSLGIVGKGFDFTIYADNDIAKYVSYAARVHHLFLITSPQIQINL